MKLEPCFFCKKIDNIYIIPFEKPRIVAFSDCHSVWSAYLVCWCTQWDGDSIRTEVLSKEEAIEHAIKRWNRKQEELFGKLGATEPIIKAEDWLKEHE